MLVLPECNNRWLSKAVNFVAATHLMGQKRCRGTPRLPDNFLYIIILLPPVIMAGGFLTLYDNFRLGMKHWVLKYA